MCFTRWGRVVGQPFIWGTFGTTIDDWPRALDGRGDHGASQLVKIPGARSLSIASPSDTRAGSCINQSPPSSAWLGSLLTVFGGSWPQAEASLVAVSGRVHDAQLHVFVKPLDVRPHPSKGRIHVTLPSLDVQYGSDLRFNRLMCSPRPVPYRAATMPQPRSLAAR